MSNNQEIMVMLADDDKDDQFFFKHAIARLGVPVQVLTANNGLDLIEYLKCPNNPVPHLIFLDINMPILNGLECLPLIRKIQTCCNLPVVIYSTTSEKEEVEEALKRGANTCITKPYEIATPKEILNKILMSNQDYFFNNNDSDTFCVN